VSIFRAGDQLGLITQCPFSDAGDDCGGHGLTEAGRCCNVAGRVAIVGQDHAETSLQGGAGRGADTHLGQQPRDGQPADLVPDEYPAKVSALESIVAGFADDQDPGG
jgi:hypothetical protein